LAQRQGVPPKTEAEGVLSKNILSVVQRLLGRDQGGGVHGEKVAVGPVRRRGEARGETGLSNLRR
jgi:hypothetical protein